MINKRLFISYNFHQSLFALYDKVLAMEKKLLCINHFFSMPKNPPSP
jgi:hypothetical protein